MTSDRVTAVAALGFVLGLAAGGCAEVPVFEVAGQATMPVYLSLPLDVVPGDLIHYRWELVEAPAGSHAGAPAVDTPDATFIPDLRGVYLVDRWLAAGLSEDLTHHVVITAVPIGPHADIHGVADLFLGTTTTLDASPSQSPEHRALTYHWRLAMRPAGSQATLPTPDAVQVSLVPDVVGEYVVELDVFDGEVWSQPPASVTIRARAP